MNNNLWLDDTHFMKHILDRLSYINDMYAGGAGRPEAMAELVNDVKLRAGRFQADFTRASRMLHFLDFVSRYDAIHPETEQYLREIGRID